MPHASRLSQRPFAQDEQCEFALPLVPHDFICKRARRLFFS
jgi:hypothetical protein